MARTLEAHDKLIREIFEGSYQFEIPDYQRPYAWTTEQAEELFNDLVSAMEDAKGAATPTQYFLGSIVLIKKDRETKSFVVDGQQRLSTLTMLFSALRATMPAAADDITDFLYKKGKASLGETNEYRLIAREEDAMFFRKFIQEPGGIELLIANTEKLDDSRLRYRENAALLLNKASGLAEPAREALWKFIANDCSLVVISTPDLDAAYRIFSVLNNRGLDLAPIDILKAEILGSIRKIAGETKGGEYAKKWSGIEIDLGREAFGELFTHIRSIYAKQKQRATLVKEFQEFVPDYKKPAQLVDDVISPFAEVWDFIRQANFEATESAEAINEHLLWLNRIDFKDWVPPALLYFKRFRQKPALLKEFFRRLERLTYFLAVTKEGVNDRIELFARLTKEIEPEAFEGDVEKLEVLSLDAKQQRDFMAALDGDIYRRLPKVRMPLVLRLEGLVSDGSKKQSFDYLSLEHVLPQTPKADSDWIKWFPKDDEREAWTHRLANLVPLHIRKNPSASNLDFKTKKEVYFTGKGKSSPFILTNEARSNVEWTPKYLDERQQRLVSILYSYWELSATLPEAEATSGRQGPAG